MTRSTADLPVARIARVALTSIAAAIVALFAFAGAIAAVGLPVRPFDRLGPSFFASDVVAERTAQAFLSARQQTATQARTAPEVAPPSYGTLRQAAFDALGRNSIDSLGATVGSFALETAGDKPGARRMLDRSGQLSRRDQLARYWMMMTAMQSGDISGMLRNLDVFLRSIADPPPEMFQQLVPLLTMPQGRQALEKLVRSQPNWLTALYESFVANAPQSAQVAQLMMTSGYSFPDGARERAVYASLVRRLADQGAADELRKIYPRLPGSDVRLLSAITPGTQSRLADYPPITWGLSDSSDVGGELLANNGRQEEAYLELTASPGHHDVAASKVVYGRAGGSLVASTTANQAAGSSAYLIARCLDGAGMPVSSANLMAQRQTRVAMPLPAGCAAFRIDVEMTGGVGRSAATLDLRDLALR